MQFLFTIQTNNGTVIAEQLRKIASEIDGKRVSHGFGRSIQPSGIVRMDVEQRYYESREEAEDVLGSLEWHESEENEYGTQFGACIAIVNKKGNDK